MNNFHIDITTDNEDEMASVLQIAFNHAGGSASGYILVDDNVLVFFWHDSGMDSPLRDKDHELVKGCSDYSKFPGRIQATSAAVLVKEWAKTGKRVGGIDMDGTCEPNAYRVFNEECRCVYQNYYAFVAVQLCHAWYGK